MVDSLFPVFRFLGKLGGPIVVVVVVVVIVGVTRLGIGDLVSAVGRGSSLSTIFPILDGHLLIKLGIIHVAREKTLYYHGTIVAEESCLIV